MKASFKIFACATASIVLLSCGDVGTNANANINNSGEPASCSQLLRTYISYDVYDGPYDPAIVIIVGDVKDWMDEQIAAGGKERKLIWISMSDLPLLNNPMEEPEITGTYNSTTRESKWFLNGQEITYDELKEFTNAWEKEQIKHREDIISSYMSSVHIPGEEVEIRHGGWKALMTAEDIVELTENNEGLAISFFEEAEAPYEPTIPGYYESDGGNGNEWVAAGTGRSSSHPCH